MKNSIGQFIRNNNSWILIIALIFLSYTRILTFRTEFNFSYVYVHPDKWVLYFKFLFFLLVVFSPAVLFSSLRRKIRAHFSKTNYVLLWLLAFLAFPCFWGLSPFTKTLVPVRMEPEVIVIFFMPLIMLIDLLTIPKEKKSNVPRVKISGKLKSPNVMVLILFVLLSLYYAFQLIQTNKVEGGFLFVWIQSLVIISVYYLFYFINHHFLVELIYKFKGLVYYLFSLLGLVIIFFVPLLLLNFYLPAYRSIMRYQHGEHWVGENAPLAFWSIHPGSIVFLMFLTIPLIILIQWYKQKNKIDRLEKEKSNTELNLLKQQINPHFFFNTLNNLYSMSLTKDSNTSEGILHLSDLMRYVIYKGAEKTVSISEEIKYIEDYLKLQSLRIHQNFALKFEKNITDSTMQITPLLFIILIENAFKHGIEGAENPSYLNVNLNQTQDSIILYCENSIESMGIEKPGLGLKNLRRRLQLIYPDRHTLDVKKNNDHYIAQLEIKI